MSVLLYQLSYRPFGCDTIQGPTVRAVARSADAVIREVVDPCRTTGQDSPETRKPSPSGSSRSVTWLSRVLPSRMV